MNLERRVPGESMENMRVVYSNREVVYLKYTPKEDG